jgi:hypothetical protein
LRITGGSFGASSIEPPSIFSKEPNMAEHDKFDNSDRMPLTRDTGHSHDVTDQAKHLTGKNGEKGASVPQSQHETAYPEPWVRETPISAFDTEGHFSRPEHQSKQRAHLPSKDETK